MEPHKFYLVNYQYLGKFQLGLSLEKVSVVFVVMVVLMVFYIKIVLNIKEYASVKIIGFLKVKNT